jgi:hypothetical protein
LALKKGFGQSPNPAAPEGKWRGKRRIEKKNDICSEEGNEGVQVSTVTT